MNGGAGEISGGRPPGSGYSAPPLQHALGPGGMARLSAATLGLSAAISVITTYLPLLLERFTTSSTLIGLAIGGEGLFGLAIPVFGGALSDRIWTRWGRRRPFMIFAAPFMAAALILVPFQGSFPAVAIMTFLFFAAYHIYSAPYQSLLAETIPYEQQGRLQGMQTLMRGLGMFAGMVVAGVLLESWEPLPFVLTGGIVLAVTYVTVMSICESREEDLGESAWPGVRSLLTGTTDVWRSLRRERPIMHLLAANFLWESTIAGIRPFIMLYFLYVLGRDTRQGALLLGLMGVTYVVAGLASGYLADRVGRRRVMAWGLGLYLAGCVLGFFIRDLWLAALMLPIFGLGGAIVLTLPFALLMGMMPAGRAGQFTGLFVMSRGLAIIVAPVVTGAAIDFASHLDPSTRGYSVIWPLAGLAVLISIFFYRRTDTARV